MKVIHLIGGGDTGGAKTHVLNLLKELNAHIDARLVCFRKGEFSDDAERMGIPITVIDSGNLFVGLRELRKLIEKDPVDIIHCHGARGNLMGNLVKKYCNAPVITTVHSDYRLDYVGRPAAAVFYGLTNTVALRKVNYYIAVADPMAELLIDRNFPADRIFTMYNGIDFKPSQQVKPKAEFLRSLGLDYNDGDVVAGIAARLTPVKDYPTLLKAMKKAVAEVPNLKLVAAGDGEDREKLLEMVKELGLEKNVCFAGWVKDTASFFGSLDMNLLTSTTEGFPYVLPEGARAKLATVASRVGGVPIIVEDGRTGLLFEPGDADALAGHLVRLTKDADLRRSLGEAIYEKARREFSIDHMVEYQLEIYQSVLEREKRKKYTAKKRDGVIICGAYGHGNAGDDAILKSIITSVNEIDKNMPITVLAKNTLSIKKRYRVESIHTLNVPKFLWAMRKSKLYINGGGTLIQNATSQRSLWYYLFTLRAAKTLGNKVDMYGCGIGPVNGEKNIRLVTKVLNKYVDTITLRERESVAELEKMGVNKPAVHLCSDPALSLAPAPREDAEAYLKKHDIDPNGKYLCFMLRTWYGFDVKTEAFARCAEYAYEKYGFTPVFLSLNILHDYKAAAQVIEHIKCPYIVLDDEAEPEMLITMLSYMSVVVSMRLHGLILSSLSGVPLVGVSYDPKTDSFLKYLELGSCIGLNDVTVENLTAAVDTAVAQMPDREVLAQRAATLKAVERGNIEAVAKLLGEK